MSLSKIIHSEIWSKDLVVRVLYITMLALKNKNGVVDASKDALIRAANIYPIYFDDTIDYLESNGWIKTIEDGWVVITQSQKEKKEKAKWKLDYNIYLKEAGKAYCNLKSDTKWIKSRERYHPNLDILLSIEKAFVDYWGTELGWERKKKGKPDSINWKSTLQNALTMKCNQVWKDKNKQDQDSEFNNPVYYR